MRAISCCHISFKGKPLLSKEETTTMKVYLQILRTVVKPWIEIVAFSQEAKIFQQDSPPSDTSHLVQNWLPDNNEVFYSKKFQLLNSPDLNPLIIIFGILLKGYLISQVSQCGNLQASILQIWTRNSRREYEQ